MKQILSYFWLDRLSLIFLILGIMANLGLWFIWTKTHFSFIAILFATGVVLLNTSFSLYCARRDAIIAPLLLGTSLLVQIFFLILIRHSLFGSY